MTITDSRIIEDLYTIYKKKPAFTGSTLPSTATYGSHYFCYKNQWYELTEQQAALWQNMRLIMASPRLSKAQGACAYVPMRDFITAFQTVESTTKDTPTQTVAPTPPVQKIETPVSSSPVLEMLHGRIHKTGKKR